MLETIREKITDYIEQKRKSVYNDWLQFIRDINDGQISCTVLLSNIDIQFGLMGYKIVHSISGNVIATRPYFGDKFIVNERNIIKLLLSRNSLIIDFDKGTISKVTTQQEIHTGRINHIVIDYIGNRIAFITDNVDMTREFMFSIKGCEKLFRKYGYVLKELTK